MLCCRRRGRERRNNRTWSYCNDYNDLRPPHGQLSSSLPRRHHLFYDCLRRHSFILSRRHYIDNSNNNILTCFFLSFFLLLLLLLLLSTTLKKVGLKVGWCHSDERWNGGKSGDKILHTHLPLLSLSLSLSLSVVLSRLVDCFVVFLSIQQIKKSLESIDRRGIFTIRPNAIDGDMWIHHHITTTIGSSPVRCGAAQEEEEEE